MKSVVEQVKDLLMPFLTKNDVELYDVQFVKEGKERYLRVFIDKETGIGLEDCERVSKFLSGELDRLDPIKEQYYLEVSSPGAERELRSDRDFERFQGHRVNVALHQSLQGTKLISGRLVRKDEEELILESLQGGKEIRIPKGYVKKVKNVLEI